MHMHACEGNKAKASVGLLCSWRFCLMPYIISFRAQHAYHWLGGVRDEFAGFGKAMQRVASSVMIGHNKL